MSETAWAAWRGAEAKLARSGDADAAARELPERQAWLLRATAAVEAGNRAALEALRTTAPSLELELLAELALSDPGDIDPTRLRATLKHAGIRNEPLPRLDLVRLACVAHNAEPPTRPPTLAKASRSRPVLAGALEVLSDRFRPKTAAADLLARSPRMASFWAAGVAQHESTGDVRGFVRESYAGVQPLPQELWPDLDEPLRSAPRRHRSVSLADFLRDPLAEPWSASCELHAATLRTRGDRSQRLEAIGGLLDAIDALVREARPLAAIPAVHVAVDLVEASPEIRQRGVLLNQLYLLDLRLRWSSPEAFTDDIFQAVWSGLHDLPAEDRARFARTMLERAEGPPRSRRVRTEVLASAVRSDADWERELLPALRVFGRDVDLRAFQSALRDAPARQRDLALGYLQAFHGSLVETLRLAARVLEHSAGQDVSRLVIEAVVRAGDAPVRRRQERRLRERALLEVARAADACAEPLGAEALVALLAVLRTLPQDAHQGELMAALISCARKRLLQPPGAQHADLIHRLQLLTTLGLEEEAQAAFRDFGRWLRRADLEEAIPAALRLCAGMCPDEETIRSYGFYDEEVDLEGDPRPAWVRSLTAWLDRESTEVVGRHALALARSDAVDPEGLETWFQEVSDLESCEAWDALEELRMPQGAIDFAGLLQQLAEEFDQGFDGREDIFDGRRQKNERKRKDKRQQRQAARRAQPKRENLETEVDLRMRHPELARPPVYLDSAGERIPDPYACLGLEPDPPPTPEAVQAAFRSALAATSPEADPQRARELVQARQFLLEPGEIVGRTLGDLRVPDARHFVPGYESRVISGEAPTQAVDWSSRSRLIALMTLYALLEEELEGDAESKRSGLLFE